MQTKAFPKTEIRLALAGWWDEYTRFSLQHAQQRPRQSAGSPASHGVQSRKGSTTVFAVQSAISAEESLIPLLRLKPVLGFEVGSDVIRRDGYNSKKEFLDDLCSKLESEFNAHSSKAGALKKPALRPGRNR
jgi:hypothetical protein